MKSEYFDFELDYQCAYADCLSKAAAKGYCRKHYRKVYQGKMKEHPEEIFKYEPSYSFDDYCSGVIK